jgi:hypothetical protein
MEVQNARQRKPESPRLFVVRCRTLANKLMCNADVTANQSMHPKHANRILLAIFVGGLTGFVWSPNEYKNLVVC